MKILIIRNAFSHDFGGAERLAVHLAQELALNDIAPLVVSRQQKLLDYASSSNVPILRGWWWSQQNWSGRLALLFPLYLIWEFLLFCWYVNIITRYPVNAVHIMSKDDFIAATFAAKLLRKRVIWTDPADLKHIFANHKKWHKNPVGKLVYLASMHADYIGLVSHSEQSLIEDSLGGNIPANFHVMHIAGKDELVTPIVRSIEDRDAVVFCSTSRLVKAKGIGELIEGFNRLSRDDNRFRLWLVGDGPDKDIFTKQAKGNKYINFIGHSKTPLRYVAAADVFVHPTHHEGFSLSLTEAAMLGKPMVATRVGGNPELVNKQNGMLVPAKDPESLYEAMKKIGTDSSMRLRLGRAARTDYREKFDFSTIVSRQLIPLYGKSEVNL